MADQLDVGRLSLNDQHAPNGGHLDRAAYIPPHLRGRPGGAPAGPAPAMDGPMMNGNSPGLNGSAWGPTPRSVHKLSTRNIVS